MSHARRSWTGVWVAAAVLALGTGNAATLGAAEILACRNNSSGTVKIVSSPAQCSQNETLVTWPGSPSRFELKTHLGGVQTVVDNATGLEWEMKVACGAVNMTNPHCVENEYFWSTVPNPGGTLFNDFLNKLNVAVGSSSPDGATLNPGSCYAGHCDWRVPDIVELQSILAAPYPGCPSSPCIDAVFGPTRAAGYWSSTITDSGPPVPWGVDFGNGQVAVANLLNLVSARAVRGSR